MIAGVTGCEVLGIGKRCVTCDTYVYNPANGNQLGSTSKQVCDNQSGIDQYVTDNTNVKNGVGQKTTCH